MLTTPADARMLAESGVVALQQGDARKARELFERIVAAGQADASIFLGLAYACANLKDTPAAIAAADGALALEPRNLRALMIKADHLAATGDARAASSFYRAVVNAASRADQLPADLRAELGRAQAMCDRYAVQFEAVLRAQLSRTGRGEEQGSARFAQSLDILCGKKQIYFQDPRYYFFPGLAQIQFFERGEFDRSFE